MGNYVKISVQILSNINRTYEAFTSVWVRYWVKLSAHHNLIPADYTDLYPCQIVWRWSMNWVKYTFATVKVAENMAL